MDKPELKRAVEGILFASERPLNPAQVREAFEEGISEADIGAVLEALRNEYDAGERGFRLIEIAGGFQLVTDPGLGERLKKFFQAKLKKRLSQATLETLSVIAYRQPVTRADIEFVRGVNVDGALKTLLEKDLVRIVGRKEAPGRPMLFGTTRFFLEHFGLGSLKDLPPLNQYTENDLDAAILPPEMIPPPVSCDRSKQAVEKRSVPSNDGTKQVVG